MSEHWGERHDHSAEQQRAEKDQARKRRVILGVVIVVLLVAGYFIATLALPRWWASAIGSQAGGKDGHGGSGTWWGLGYGFVFTLIPLIVLRQLVRKGLTWKARGWIVLGAVILAAPNLMTLGIVAGSGSGAHKGSNTMDLRAPGFRGATLIAVIVAAVVFVIGQYLVTARRRRERAAGSARAHADGREPGQGTPGADRPV
ncbi:MAG: permease [Actinomycetia bacterium]|nr:permease [Actinomycetes bacterium]